MKDRYLEHINKMYTKFIVEDDDCNEIISFDDAFEREKWKNENCLETMDAVFYNGVRIWYNES